MMIGDDDYVEVQDVDGDVVLELRSQKDEENPAAEGKLVFRNPEADLLKLSDRKELFTELQNFLDEVRDFAVNIGTKHGVKLNMEAVFDIKKIKFKKSQIK